MNILIIGKQKKDKSLSILTHRQVKSLKQSSKDTTISTYSIKHSGVKGYFRSYTKLKKYLSKQNHCIIHAHYSLIGVIVLLACNKEKVVVSFMGSDVYFNGLIFKAARWIVLRKADHIIVKSEQLRQKFPHKKNISVIPNGVDLELFRPIDKSQAQERLTWSKDKVHILFPASKDRFEKNYPLAEQAIQLLKTKYNIELHLLENIAPDEVPFYLNAADLVLLTSRWEGSSNVTKEAMACNTPVVSTNVGDASELFKGIEGYFIAEHTASELVKQLERTISFAMEKQKTQGREQIIRLGLDEASIAIKLIDVYHQLEVRKC